MRDLAPLAAAVAALALAGCATPAAPLDGEAAMRGRAKAAIEAATPRGGDLRLSCTPPEAEVLLDGVQQGRCSDLSAGLRLGRGMHRVEVRREGFSPYLSYYQPSGARAALTVVLRPLEGAVR